MVIGCSSRQSTSSLFNAALMSCVATAVAIWALFSTPVPAALMLVCLAALSYIGYIVGGRDVLYPGFVFCAVWTIVSAVYLTGPETIDQLSWSSVSIFICGGAFFSIGSAVGNRDLTIVTRSRCDNRDHVYDLNSQGRLLLLGYCLITLPFFIRDTMRIAGDFSLSPMYFIGLREAIVNSFLEGVVPYSSKLVSTAPMIAVVTAWVFIIEETRKFLVAIAIAIAVVFCLLTSGRTMLMQFICGWVTIAMLRRDDRSFTRTAKPLIAIALLALLLMTGLTFVNKAETVESGGIELAKNMTVAYIAGPLAGFDYAVQHPGMFAAQSNNTFSELLEPVGKLGVLHYRPPALIEEFVFVPFPMNVYTAYKPYYVDFGMTGCCLAFLLFGAVHGYLFRASTRGNRGAMLLMAYLTYPLVFSTFIDNYHFLTRYAYLCIYIALYYCVLKKLPRFTLLPVNPFSCLKAADQQHKYKR